MPILGIDSDNDSAFTNDHLRRYASGHVPSCIQRERITFTGCRACKKNDQAHV